MIDVVYLAYLDEDLGYGIDIVEQFLDSYNKHQAGVEHNLIFAVNNKKNKFLYSKLCYLAKSNNIKLLNLPEDGLDIGAFIRAAKTSNSEYMFFIGSAVSILCDNWLLKFSNALEQNSSIQLVGPMGSYAKGHSDKFPNPHIRTCSFMINRELFLEYAATQKFPETKDDTWEIEHGVNSLSNFILNKGYKMVVVNSDGNIFEPNDWENSQTYITSKEPKAILDDKWARRYYFTDECLRTKIEMETWGKNQTKYPSNFVKDYSSKVNIFIPYFNIVPVYSTDVFHPIFIGEVNSKLHTDALQDNSGENIFQKSKLYGELSAYYWVWKNFLSTAESNYVGFCQFYHFLDFSINITNTAAFKLIYLDEFKDVFEKYTEENISKFIQEYDVVLPTQIPLKTNLYAQYLKNHKKEDLDLTFDVIKEIYPQYTNAINDVMLSNFMFTFGNFVMKKDVFSNFCQWLFNLLNSVEEKINWNEYGRYKDIVSSVFITERLFNIWLSYNSKVNNFNIKTLPSFMVSPDERKCLNKCLNDIQKVKEQIKRP